MTTKWTDELKAKVVKMYLDADPSPETSTEIIKDIAEEIEASPNGVRMQLVQAKVYVKKEPSTGSKTSGKTTEGGAKRVSKESAIQELREAIESRGAPIDDDILGKLTGKAAVYLLSVIKA
jgi:transposase-like protein